MTAGSVLALIKALGGSGGGGGSSGGGAFVVNLTADWDNDTYTSYKTAKEIYDAAAVGDIVFILADAGGVFHYKLWQITVTSNVYNCVIFSNEGGRMTAENLAATDYPVFTYYE